MAEPITPDQAMAIMACYTLIVGSVSFGFGWWGANRQAAKRDAVRRREVEVETLAALRAAAEKGDA